MTNTVFDHDQMLCACTHQGGQHGNESPDGAWLGIGRGACYGKTSLGECDCERWRSPRGEVA